MSETTLARPSMSRWCVGYGLDIGFGGDKILPGAIGVDMPKPYTKVGQDPVQLGGDARDLRWFRDGVLDYVYSSHLLEDFEDTRTVLREWARVLRPGGHLVLYLPYEKAYRAHCDHLGQQRNAWHKHPDFDAGHVKRCAEGLGLTPVHESGLVGEYSFELVFRKD